VIVEWFTVTIATAITTAAFTVTTFTAFAFFALLVDVVKDLSCTPTTIGLVETAAFDPLHELSILVEYLDVDFIVHRTVGCARTLPPEMPPRNQVAIHLVIHLMQNEKA